MKKLLVFCLFCWGLYLLWQSWETRSATLDLEGSGYKLTYSVVWGMSMHERLSVARAEQPFSGSSSEWLELYKKPYNSGLAVYRTLDGSAYYFGFLYRTIRFDPASGTLKALCEKPAEVGYTDEGARLAQMKDVVLSQQADAGAPRLFDHIDGDWLAASTGKPVASKYYANLQYLGRFGILDGGLRGTDVGFLPAARPEPHLALNAGCG